MKKKILIAAAAVLVAAAGVFGFFVVSDMIQENRLEAELDEINAMVNAENIDLDAVYERLDTTVTGGDYAVVETAVKSYLRDSFDNSVRIAEILNDERITGILTAENYEADGKAFEQTKKYITETRTELETLKSDYSAFFTEEKAMSYINDKGLDSYYTDLYKDRYIGDLEAAGSDKTVENSIDEIINTLNISEDVINYLAENQSSWQLSGGSIVFDSEEQSAEYDRLIAGLSGGAET